MKKKHWFYRVFWSFKTRMRQEDAINIQFKSHQKTGKTLVSFTLAVSRCRYLQVTATNKSKSTEVKVRHTIRLRTTPSWHIASCHT